MFTVSLYPCPIWDDDNQQSDRMMKDLTVILLLLKTLILETFYFILFKKKPVLTISLQSMSTITKQATMIFVSL